MSQYKAIYVMGDASGYNGIWVTDGTSAGSSELSVGNLPNNGTDATLTDAAIYNGTAYFVSANASGAEEIWRSDGTSSGTYQTGISEQSSASLIAGSPNGVYFGQYDAATGDVDLWVYTSAGATQLAAGAQLISSMVGTLGSIDFLSTDGNYVGGGIEFQHALEVTNGTAAGTTALPYEDAGQFYTFGNKEIFAAIPDLPTENGTPSIYISDGTAAGTSLLFSNYGLFAASLSYATIGNELLIAGAGRLLVSDGTQNGTTPVTLKNVYVDGSQGLDGKPGVSILSLGSRAIFIGEDGSIASSTVFTTDGTSAGTSVLIPAGLTTDMEEVNNLTPLNSSQVLFTGDGTPGEEGLWVSDGTSKGTTELAIPDYTGGELKNLTQLGGEVLFEGGNSEYQDAFWITDGTSAGTKEVTTEPWNTSGAGGTAAAAIAAIQGPATATVSGGGVDLPGNGGPDTVTASSGASTVSTTKNQAFVFLGAGPDLVNSYGSDTIVAGTGGATVNAYGAPLYFGGGGATLFNALGASATLVGSGNETVNAGASKLLVFGGPTGGLDFVAGRGTSTVVSYAGGGTLVGGSASTLYFGIGPASYQAGTAVDTVIGYGGAMTATGGANGTLFFTGSAGGNVLSTGSGSSTIIGFGPGDVFNATGAGNSVIEAAGASETIDGSQSTGSNAFFAYAANDVVIGGSGPNAIQSAFGNQTLVAGSGSTLFQILDSAANRSITIENFSKSSSLVQFQSYPTGIAVSALQTATVANGSEMLTLNDGTTVKFMGVTGLTSSSFA